MKEKLWLAGASFGFAVILWALSPSMAFGLTLLTLLFVAGFAIFWTELGKYRKPFITVIAVLIIASVLMLPNRREFFMSWRQSTDKLVQDVSAATSEPLPKKVVKFPFGPGERVGSNVEPAKGQKYMIEATVPVKKKNADMPGGWEIITRPSTFFARGDGEIAVYSTDKSGEVTFTIF